MYIVNMRKSKVLDSRRKGNFLLFVFQELMSEKPIVEIKGPIKSIHQFVDMTTEEVDYKVPGGEMVKGKGCRPAMGHTFSSGTIDGPGLFSFEGGSKSSNNPLWDLVTNFVPKPSPEQVECHAEKSILISTGEVSETKNTTIL